jgi:hypothetical protein
VTRVQSGAVGMDEPQQQAAETPRGYRLRRPIRPSSLLCAKSGGVPLAGVIHSSHCQMSQLFLRARQWLFEAFT